MREVLEGFCWHSSTGMDSVLGDSKRFVVRLPNTKTARSMFVASGRNLLIHKTTNCLWKMSDDKKSIEPVFSSDVLTEEEVKMAMGEVQ